MKDQTLLNTAVRSFYDSQKIRIQLGNRIVASFRDKLGIEPSEAEENEPKGKEVLEALREEYTRITDGVVRITKKWKPRSDLLTSPAEVMLIQAYMEMLDSENTQFKLIKYELEKEPIYTQFLVKILGVGPTMSGVIVSEIDISQCHYASSIWAYAGLDVVINEEGSGEGRSRKKHHLVENIYKDKNGKEKKTQGITFNPFLKTKLVGVLAGSFLKAKSPYRDYYDNYKHRLQNDPRHTEKTDGHRHAMAMRYMIKMFLSDLYVAWRTLEGLPVQPSYQESKLGHKHHDRAA